MFMSIIRLFIAANIALAFAASVTRIMIDKKKKKHMLFNNTAIVVYLSLPRYIL